MQTYKKHIQTVKIKLIFILFFFCRISKWGAENLIMGCKGKNIYWCEPIRAKRKHTPLCSLKSWLSFYCKMLLCILRLQHTFQVVGILLIVMRLIWHGLNNYLPASDWHSHKKGWVGLGSRWWHSTWPNWSISMLGRRCSTGGQHHTIYFTIYGAQTHGHQIVAPWGSACSSVPLCQGWWHQNFPSALPQDAKKKEEKKHTVQNLQ